MSQQGRILIGPAGWSYQDWKTTVFAGIKSKIDALEFISSYFDTVEINSTFYRIPSISTVKSWTRRVRQDGSFLFTLKLYRGFTHDPAIIAKNDRASMNRVCETLQAAGLLGAVLAQFPYRFHNTQENRKYLADLRSDFPDLPMVVEFRHRSWLHRAVQSFLRDLSLGFCNIDQPEVSYSIPLTSIVTTSIGYVRCHGRNVENWFGKESTRDSRYFYRYRPEELGEIASVARKIAQETERTFVIFNNHYKGNEIFDAVSFAKIMGLG
ncbi:MAG: DUF72 domain-containing protein, partial [Thermodesulforhabdaceae bacterium]